MRNEIIAQRFNGTHALYNLKNADILDCVFAGPADGASALKEARNVNLENCSFSLRHPLWHAEKFRLHDSRLDEDTRAPLWYCQSGQITDSDILGPRAIRECKNITIRDCNVTSEEFGRQSIGIAVTDSTLDARHLFLDSRNVTLENVKTSGSYSFRNTENLTIRNSVLDTKDGFWYSKNITVEDCLVMGDHLGWFSDGLTLRRCKIVGTQPLCYCKNLTLVDCTMEGCDLAFENSDVNASLIGHVDSIRNPRSGEIVADTVGELILEDAVTECTVTIR